MTADTTDWLESLSFSSLDGSRFAFSFDWDYPARGVNRLAEAITRDFNLRRAARRQKQEAAKGGMKPNEPNTKSETAPAALKWLKPVCYNAILSCVHFEVFDELEQRIAVHDRLKRGPKAHQDIFSVGLMGLFAHTPTFPSGERQGTAESSTSPLLDDKERSRMAKDMWWAFRHYVEPAELLQFTRKYRPKLRTMAADEVIPELKDQIARRRALFERLSSDLETFRDEYPHDVLDLSLLYQESFEELARRQRQEVKAKQQRDTAGEADDWDDDDEDDDADWESSRKGKATWDDDDDED